MDAAFLGTPALGRTAVVDDLRAAGGRGAIDVGRPSPSNGSLWFAGGLFQFSPPRKLGLSPFTVVVSISPWATAIEYSPAESGRKSPGAGDVAHRN